jgi:hypothetical protein
MQKQKQNKKAGRGHPLPFFTHKQTGPNNLLQIYNNAKNIKNGRKI